MRTSSVPASSRATRCMLLPLLLGGACSKSEVDSGAPAPSAQLVGSQTPLHNVGETAHHSLFDLTVMNVKSCSVEPHFQPAAGVRKLGVELRLAGLGDVEVPANPFYAVVADPQGTRYEATLAGCTPVLEAARVKAGDTATGWITFDVPDGLRAARFIYAPAIIGATTPEVTFELSP